MREGRKGLTPPQWIIGVAGSRYFLVSRNVKEPSSAAAVASSTVGLVVGSGRDSGCCFPNKIRHQILDATLALLFATEMVTKFECRVQKCESLPRNVV